MLTFQTFPSESVMKWEVEIYLLDSPMHEGGVFPKDGIDYTNMPFISDSEILQYQIIQNYPNRGSVYSIMLSNTAGNKLRKLDIPVCCGRHFVIAVNKRPILDGYFWSPVSSYSCDSLIAEISTFNNLEIRNGYPKERSLGDFPDPSCDRTLLQAFSETKRLLGI